jgi:alkylhydroperoxidase/carboxymuconolactone decarboxylase family protein YurZ
MTDKNKEAMEHRERVLGPHGLEGTLHKEEAEFFVGEFRDLVVNTAWGTVWKRDGLSLRDRRLITMTAIMANKQTAEFRLHLRAALDDGMTPEEVRELLIHCAVYLGFPSSVSFFGEAWPIVKEHIDRQG